MKIVQINATAQSGSTGNICCAVSKLLNENNIENYIFYSLDNSNEKNAIKYLSKSNIKLQALQSRIFGNYGFEAKNATKKLINYLEEIKPDIIHLHNIHSHNCNLELLFNYIRTNNIKTFWTFHDCWAFTAYCPYFDMIGCDKWKTKCKNCPQYKEFSWFFDKSQYIFDQKKSSMQNLYLTIITPSQWLAGLVKQSFLKEYPVKVINNGIDLSIFKPINNDIKVKYNCENKYLILGVAFGWGKRKGLDVFVELFKRLDRNKYKIMLVGTDEHIEKDLPDNIISIHRTKNQNELAEIYSAADLFVNPTREENYPTVNMESLACGTPVLTFDTGGSPEIIDETCGIVVEKDDIDSMYNEIINICENNVFTKDACLRKSKQFDMNERFKEYLQLYMSLCGEYNEQY